MDDGKKHDRDDVERLKEVAHDLEARAAKRKDEARRALDEAKELEKEEKQVEEVIHEIEERDHGEGGHTDGCFAITASVNTQRLEMEVRPEERLETVRARALEETHNVARPPEKWDVKTEADTILDVHLTVAQAGIVVGALIFISLQAGAAGA